jgi:hypothetical protein
MIPELCVLDSNCKWNFTGTKLGKAGRPVAISGGSAWKEAGDCYERFGGGSSDEVCDRATPTIASTCILIPFRSVKKRNKFVDVIRQFISCLLKRGRHRGFYDRLCATHPMSIITANFRTSKPYKTFRCTGRVCCSSHATTSAPSPTLSQKMKSAAFASKQTSTIVLLPLHALLNRLISFTRSASRRG